MINLLLPRPAYRSHVFGNRNLLMERIALSLFPLPLLSRQVLLVSRSPAPRCLRMLKQRITYVSAYVGEHCLFPERAGGCLQGYAQDITKNQCVRSMGWRRGRKDRSRGAWFCGKCCPCIPELPGRQMEEGSSICSVVLIEANQFWGSWLAPALRTSRGFGGVSSRGRQDGHVTPRGGRVTYVP